MCHSFRLLILIPFFVAALATMSPVHAEDPLDDAIQEFALLQAMKAYDLKCHALDADAREVMDAFALNRIASMKISDSIKEEFRKGWKEEKGDPEIDCSTDGALFSDGFELFRKGAREIASARAAAAKPDPEFGLEAAREVVTQLPKGRIAHLRGCYEGSEGEWFFNLCLGESDQASLKITHARTKTSCDLSQGEGRKRESGLYFYAASPRRQCSDGSRITHAEGICEDLSGSLGCLVSVYKKENEFFLFQGSKETVNGQIRMRKVQKR